MCSSDLSMFLQKGSDSSGICGGGDLIDDENIAADNGSEVRSFFSLNPYCGLRVRQNGTMANDLFVKSRWIFGGFSGPSRGVDSTKKGTDELPPGKRRRVEGASVNSKKANPALI